MLRKLFALGVTVSGTLLGQRLLPVSLTLENEAASKSTAAITVPQVQQTSSVPAWEHTFDRFVDLKDATFALRYRSVFDSNNAHEFNQGQQRSILDGKFKFDPAGKYAVGFHISSGHYFNWAYADFMGGGNKQALAIETAKTSPFQHFIISDITLHDAAEVNASYVSGGWSMYVRRLYLDLEPVQGFELEYGSMDFNRGVSTEITTYDNDGYLAGQRLIIKRPKLFFVDEFSATLGYIGDIYAPNFFARGQRLAHPNYHQYLARKAFAHRVDSSFDYTVQSPYKMFHEAAEARIPESRVLDGIRAEFYQRLTTAAPSTSSGASSSGAPSVPYGKGYAVTLEKKLGHHLSLDGGVASIDSRFSSLTVVDIAGIFDLAVNGDQYGMGQRFFVRPTIRLTPYLEAAAFYTHTYTPNTDPIATVWNRQALNAGLVFNMRNAFFHTSGAK